MKKNEIKKMIRELNKKVGIQNMPLKLVASLCTEGFEGTEGTGVEAMAWEQGVSLTNDGRILLTFSHCGKGQGCFWETAEKLFKRNEMPVEELLRMFRGQYKNPYVQEILINKGGF